MLWQIAECVCKIELIEGHILQGIVTEGVSIVTEGVSIVTEEVNSC